MAKILVADDNSNIQKMVGLALKDEGIDVVAVGNGEAAVRKISAVRPDLVLADIFMPVRNGYEVCQYVKGDSTLSHIPVILLVGAFDPLDEQEAQRVGADGVLKKPFVPPDPLISMVKSALSRAGVSTEGAAETPASSNGAYSAAPAAPAEVQFPAQPEPFEEPIAERPAPFKIEGSSQPLAFGSLLESPAAEEDSTPVQPAQPTIVPERDWRNAKDETEAEEEEETEKTHSSWRRDGADEAFADASAPASGRLDWRDLDFARKSSQQEPASPWLEANDPSEETQVLDNEPQASTAASGMPKISDPLAPPPAAPFASDAWAAAIAAGEDESREEAHTTTEPPAPEQAAPDVSVYDQSYAQEDGPPPAPAQETPNAAPAANAWEAEAQKVSQLASTWDAHPHPHWAEAPASEHAAPEDEQSAETPPAPAYSGAVDEIAAAAPPELQLAPEQISSETFEAIREEATQEIAAEEHLDAPEFAAPEPAPSSPESVPSAESAAAPSVHVDEVVARVLARMDPEVLKAVTREILKPVVEAIVREEMASRKH